MKIKRKKLIIIFGNQSYFQNILCNYFCLLDLGNNPFLQEYLMVPGYAIPLLYLSQNIKIKEITINKGNINYASVILEFLFSLVTTFINRI